MVFGLNGRGFIFPLMIRLKLENKFGELGVCSHITRASDDKHYIIFNEERNILDVSENLFNLAFKGMFTLCKEFLKL